MRIESEKLLNGREIIIGSKYSGAVVENPFTVYVGIYNGTNYLQSLLEQIKTQELHDFPLIIVDNCSTDESWQRILNWPSEILDRSKLIRNPFNLGGTGSLSLNCSEVETDWLVTWHQDDTYSSNHLAVLCDAINVSSKREIVIFTDMGTQNMDGKKIFTPVRQSWVANLETPQNTFLSNLLQQSVSYPSAAFRMSALTPIRIPWHSSSFPDTEITLLQAPLGSFKFKPELTMLYRMNPQSESHDLDPRERVLGPFAALSRVMASDSFFRLCGDVALEERGNFAKAVLRGIDTRLGNSPFSEIVKLIASETMGLSWDYSETISRDQILRTYNIAEDGRTTKLLEELGAFFDESGLSSDKPVTLERSSAELQLKKLLDEAAPPSNSKASSFQKALLISIGSLMPLRLRRKVIAFVMRIYSKVNPKSPWNLS